MSKICQITGKKAKIKKMSDETIISYRKACVYKIKSLILHSV